jgi:hypothetical protein
VRAAYMSMGISRQELAQRTGLKPKMITNAIAGDVLGVPAAARIGAVIGWSAEEVLAGERVLERNDGDESDDVVPASLPPARPGNEPRRPPNKPDSSLAEAS